MMGPESRIVVRSHTMKEVLRMDERVEVTGSKLLLGVYNLASFKAMINLRGDKFRLLIALYTGNYRLKKHLSNMHIASCGNCRFCNGEPEIFEHLILDWTAICRHRLKALVSIYVDSNHITSIAPSRFL